MLLIILITNFCIEADAVDVFCNKINEVRNEIKERMQENKEILMTDEDKKDFETATHCFICGDKFKYSYKNEKEAEKYKKSSRPLSFYR